MGSLCKFIQKGAHFSSNSVIHIYLFFLFLRGSTHTTYNKDAAQKAKATFGFALAFRVRVFFSRVPNFFFLSFMLKEGHCSRGSTRTDFNVNQRLKSNFNLHKSIGTGTLFKINNSSGPNLKNNLLRKVACVCLYLPSS